ncbi:hypothetical protein BDZ45DRAFT_786561 [Acephala macrosclerotiorum]|nr:hypothetical protein BDZ45DRAFT_786561 [Acephala macrosclerotiorum]
MQTFHDSFHSNAQASELIELWMNILREYSLGGYIAGNWRENMKEMMLWFAFRKRFDRERSAEYVAPSWSWASSRKNVEFISSTRSARGKLKDAGGDASGQLFGGHMTVLGWSIKLKPVCSLPKDEERQDSGRYQWSQWYLACEPASTVCLAHSDYEFEFETISRDEREITGLLWDVMLDKTREKEGSGFNDPEWSSHILILQRDPQHQETYRRIGVGHVNWSYYEDPSPENETNGCRKNRGLAKDWSKDAELHMVTII